MVPHCQALGSEGMPPMPPTIIISDSFSAINSQRIIVLAQFITIIRFEQLYK